MSGKKGLNLAVHIYILLPTVIFLLGWLRPVIGIPLTVLVLFGAWRSYKDAQYMEGSAVPTMYRRRGGKADAASVVGTFRVWTGSEWIKFVVCILAIMVWVWFSGIGKLSFQNGDHVARNAIFNALVGYRWPVVTAPGDNMLIYYIGFWLPPALVGKIAGLTAGYIAQYVWAVIGVVFLYALICKWRGKVSLWPCLIMFIFSGLDIIGTVFYRLPWGFFRSDMQLEWWSMFQQYSSMTTQLYWVFNQTLPAWIVVMFCMLQKKKSNMLFLHSNMVLTATLPFIGFVPINAFLLLQGLPLKGKGKGEVWKARLKEIFSIQNIIGIICIGIPCVLYVLGNLSGAAVATGAAAGEAGATNTEYIWVKNMAFNFILFCILEFAVFFPFLCKQAGKFKGLKLVCFIWLIICPLIRVGSAYDFGMRASVPALFILMIMVIDSLDAWRRTSHNAKAIVLAVLILIGAFTPWHEFYRSARNTYHAVHAHNLAAVIERDAGLEDDDRLLYQANFSGPTEGNLFYRYFARH